MSEYPLTGELLGELLGLDEVESQLPLEILLTLHRKQLTHPFEGLLEIMATLLPLTVVPQQLAEKMVDALSKELDARYPALDDGLIFVENEELGNLEYWSRELARHASWQALADRHEFIEALMVQKNYAPVIALLQLSWQLTPVMRLNRLRALELELEAEPPIVRGMILDLAQLGAERLARSARLALI